jgi:hypothetical protein
MSNFCLQLSSGQHVKGKNIGQQIIVDIRDIISHRKMRKVAHTRFNRIFKAFPCLIDVEKSGMV